jgi:hypothetical protein
MVETVRVRCPGHRILKLVTRWAKYIKCALGIRWKMIILKGNS